MPPNTVFARVRPNYTRLQGRQLTKKLILPCVLQGRSLQHYIKYRFFPNDKMPVECLRSDDLAITDQQYTVFDGSTDCRMDACAGECPGLLAM